MCFYFPHPPLLYRWCKRSGVIQCCAGHCLIIRKLKLRCVQSACIWGARMLITDNVWLRKMCLESDSSMFHTVSLSCHLKCHHVFLPITDNSHVFLVLTYMYMYHFHVKQLIYSLVCCLKCDQVSDLKMWWDKSHITLNY